MLTKTLEQTYFVIDFDSTFTKVEALDVLGEISLAGHRDRDAILEKIKIITDRGMSGEISLSKSIELRLELLHAHRDHLPALIETLKTEISDSFQRNREFLTEHADHIYIVSSGFKEFIVPIVTSLGIKEENVFANTFVFDADGNIVGCDCENPLSTDRGKVKLIRDLKLEGDIYVIGDGYTDYEIRESGLANRFYAFTENVMRPKVIEKADHIAPSLDEFLYHNKLSRSQSYPKSRIKVLLLENVHPVAVKLFESEGFNVEILKGALDEEELIEKIRDVSILGIRSKTQVTSRVLEHASKLMCVGAFCIGTNQIDLKKGLRFSTRPTATRAPWWNWPSAKSLCWCVTLSRKAIKCTRASGINRPKTVSKCGVKNWAWWATVTSELNCRWWPKPLEWRFIFTILSINWRSVTPGNAKRWTNCSRFPISSACTPTVGPVIRTSSVPGNSG
jgi:D-3-phosphoglycerate dehydrogenase